jgi:hypothetical protein
MKRAASAVLIFAAALAVPPPALAQQPVRSFDQLNTRLKAGDTVWITDAQGREIAGRVRDLAATSLLLDAGGTPRDFQAAQVGTIHLQPKDSLKNGVLYGAILGAGAGAASCLANPQCGGDSELAAGASVGLALLGAAAGAVIGAAIDAAVKGPRVVVYRASGKAGQAPPRVSVAPMLTTRHRGIAVSVAF